MLNSSTPDAVEMSILSSQKLKTIHNTSLSILEEIGVKVLNKEALDLLDGLGAHVEKGGLVKIPSHVVDRAVRSAPKRITLFDQKGQVSMVLSDGNIYFGSNCDTSKYLDPYSGKTIPLTSKHAAALARVGDYLPNISFVYSVGQLANYDVRLGSRMAFLTALQNSNKPINFTTNDAESCADIIEMATVVAGSKENLQRKPFVFQYCEPIPPLCHDEESLNKVLYCAEAGVPLVYLPYGLMGGTTPVTFAGALAQLNADILCGLVIHQAKNEGAPFIIGSMPSTMDMRTTIGTYGAPEFHMLIAAASELAKFYGLPFYGTAGCTDAKKLDYQAVMEVTMNCFSSLLSKANIVHDIGFMDSSNVLSPELVVLVNEILSMLSVYKRGVQVNDETLAFNTIKDVGIGGNYLTHDHTFQHFKEIWYSDILDRSKDYTIPSANEKINLKTRNIIETHEPEPFDAETMKSVKELEKKWVSKVF